MTRREIGSIVTEFLPKVLADIVASYCEVKPHHLKGISLVESTIPRGLCRFIAHKLNTFTRDIVLPFFGNRKHESLTLRVECNPSCQIIPLPSGRFGVVDGVGIQVYTSEGEFLRRWNPFHLPDKTPIYPARIAINTTGDIIAVAYETTRTEQRVQIFDIRGDNIYPGINWGWSYYIARLIFISPDKLALIDLRFLYIRIINIEGKQLRSWQYRQPYPERPFITPNLALLRWEGKEVIAVVDRDAVRFYHGAMEGKLLREWRTELTESLPSIVQLSENEFIMYDRWWVRGHYSMDDGRHSWLYRLNESNTIWDIACITEDRIVITAQRRLGDHRIDVLELRSPSESAPT